MQRLQCPEYLSLGALISALAADDVQSSSGQRRPLDWFIARTAGRLSTEPDRKINPLTRIEGQFRNSAWLRIFADNNCSKTSKFTLTGCNSEVHNPILQNSQVAILPIGVL
jgi:hypothetical protein